QDWNNDHHGTAAGRAVPTILGMIGGVGWFGRGTKLLKSLRRTDHADTDKGRVDPDNDGEGDTDGENTDTADVDQDTPGRVGPDGVRRFGPETDDHEFGKRMLGDRYDDVSQETRHAIERYIPQPKENLGLTRPVLAKEILQSWWNDTGPGWDLFSMNGDRPPSLEDVEHALGRSDLSDTQRALVNDILNAPDPAARLEHLLNDSGARGAITRKYGKWPALLDVERELGIRSVYVPHLENIPPAVTHGPEYSTTPLLKEFVGEDRGLSPRLHYNEIDYVRDPQRRDYFRIIVHNGELFRSNGQALNTDMPSRWAENGEWIFVMDRYGNLYANGKSKPGRFQHSSFLAGDEVAAAGEFVVHDGKLVSINDASGHYEPPAEYLQQVVKMMRDAGADIDDDMITNWN
ncbi:hypothetical protein, partial [Actinomadura sp. HBU206391]|uniref:hypothetical protein n=1 Tax=Actinomadura sp. HBU206391 TaxID=2731692 RepID=UPI001C9CF853